MSVLTKNSIKEYLPRSESFGAEPWECIFRILFVFVTFDVCEVAETELSFSLDDWLSFERGTFLTAKPF